MLIAALVSLPPFGRSLWNFSRERAGAGSKGVICADGVGTKFISGKVQLPHSRRLPSLFQAKSLLLPKRSCRGDRGVRFLPHGWVKRSPRCSLSLSQGALEPWHHDEGRKETLETSRHPNGAVSLRCSRHAGRSERSRYSRASRGCSVDHAPFLFTQLP